MTTRHADEQIVKPFRMTVESKIDFDLVSNSYIPVSY